MNKFHPSTFRSMAHVKVFLWALLGQALAGNDGEESSLLQVSLLQVQLGFQQAANTGERATLSNRLQHTHLENATGLDSLTSLSSVLDLDPESIGEPTLPLDFGVYIIKSAVDTSKCLFYGTGKKACLGNMGGGAADCGYEGGDLVDDIKEVLAGRGDALTWSDNYQASGLAWVIELVHDLAGKRQYLVRTTSDWSEPPRACLQNNGELTAHSYGPKPEYCGHNDGYRGLVHHERDLLMFDYLGLTDHGEKQYTIKSDFKDTECARTNTKHPQLWETLAFGNWNPAESDSCGLGSKGGIVENEQAVWLLEHVSGTDVLSDRILTSIQGYWQPVGTLNPTVELCTEVGIEEAWEVDKVKEFSSAMESSITSSVTTSVSASAGYGPMAISGSVNSSRTVSRTVASAWSTSFRSSFSKTQSKTERMCKQIDKDLKFFYEWQWVFHVTSAASAKMDTIVKTQEVAFTLNANTPPKCFPGWQTDNFYYQTCDDDGVLP